MKIPPNKSHLQKKRVLFIAVAALLLLSGGLLLFLEKTHTTNYIKDPFYTPSEADLARDRENATINDPTTKNKGSLESNPGVDPGRTTDQVPTSSATSLNITSLVQSNGTIKSTAAITNPSGDGVCTFLFSKDGAKPITKTVNPNNKTCTVAVPEIEFEMLGIWQLTIRYFTNNTQATVNGEINVK